MERSDLNWRGVVIFGLAVLTVILLISVIDDDPAQLGINTAGTSEDSGDGTTVTTAPTGTTLPGATSTTKPGTTTTTSFNPAGRAQVQNGSTGADVQFLQQQLIRLGYLTGAADGSFGSATTAAVTKFQQDKGITPADGVVGPSTWAALAAA